MNIGEAKGRKIIAQHQRAALAHPVRLDREGPELGVMRFRLTDETVDVLLTADVDWPEGPAWHVLLTPAPLVMAEQSTEGVCSTDMPRGERGRLLRALLDVGTGDTDVFILPDGVTLHAFRLLSEAELAEIDNV